MLTNRNKTITALEIHQTSCRREIVQVFIEHSGVAFSEIEIKSGLKGHFDRTTIYRTVKILTEKNFIHRVICDFGVLKYAVTDSERLQQEHPHFQCIKCKTVFCFEGEIQNVNPPKGCLMRSQCLLITGICKCCASKTSCVA
jgi:Fur family ferric uptake transcriptional regulator